MDWFRDSSQTRESFEDNTLLGGGGLDLSGITLPPIKTQVSVSAEILLIVAAVVTTVLIVVFKPGSMKKLFR